MTPIERAEKQLNVEMRQQVWKLYPAFAIALNRLYGWKGVHCNRLFNNTKDLWDECGEDVNLSMLGMLYEETGIEIKASENGKHFWELAFLNPKLKVGTKNTMTEQQWVLMRLKQKEWVGCCVQAALLLSLKRREGFGVQRISDVYNKVNEIRSEFNDNAFKLWVTCEEQVGVMRFKGDNEW